MQKFFQKLLWKSLGILIYILEVFLVLLVIVTLGFIGTIISLTFTGLTRVCSAIKSRKEEKRK